MASDPVADLLERSHSLGSDPRTTNYGGGNTSAKGWVPDPATGDPVELVWLKGSGGDLATLRADGLAVLRRDRVEGLRAVYRGVEHEDEMVAAFDYCIHGRPQAAPSIDTSMHALVRARHVDHLHPDSGIAIATAADGERLTTEIFGERVLWIPWRRPGFQLGLDIAALQQEHPAAIGCILGGHGITAWGETSEECEARSQEIISGCAAYLAERGTADPLGAARPGFGPLERDERRRRAARLVGRLRRLAATDEHVVGHFDDSDEVLDFMAREAAPRMCGLGTSCPDHFLRTKVSPLLLDLPTTATIEESLSAWQSSTRPTGRTTAPTTSATPNPARRRCEGPTRGSSWCRASGCSASVPTS